MNTLSLFINSIIQLIVVSIIPFIWWAFTARKKESFFLWIGLKKPLIENKPQFLITFLCSLILFIIPSFFIPINSSNLATSQFAGQNISALLSVLLFSFIQTGLSEEILFRGFLNKRLCSKFGFSVGNLIQAFLFGALHGVLVYSFTGLLVAMIIIVYTGCIGWIMGWINEKKSGGSIVPSWLFHSIANLVASLLVMLNIT